MRRGLVIAATVGVTGAAVAAYVRKVEPWFRRWGATGDEVSGKLAVDDLVEPGVDATTRAITIRAPIDDVWPWLAQIGQDRAGFYSYARLENLVGAGMHNARSVHAEWQDRSRGDSVWLAEERRYHDVGRQVAALVEPPHALVLVSPDDWDRLERGARATGAWGFFLVPCGDTCTRFIIRSSGGPVGTHLFDALHFVMEQKMMRSMRDRVEALTA
ncbi:MAG TPA: hypothetical protein VFW97_14755 [Acidimicrobiia bacterium]|nr:hypothetical protein [Acidimicrobiia bacterium]